MKIHPSIDARRVIRAVESREYMGFCADCGAEAYQVEPDARDYECEECGGSRVYGAEEYLFVIDP